MSNSIVTHLIWRQTSSGTKRHDIKGVRGHNGGVHVSVVDQVTNHLQRARRSV